MLLSFFFFFFFLIAGFIAAVDDDSLSFAFLFKEKVCFKEKLYILLIYFSEIDLRQNF